MMNAVADMVRRWQDWKQTGKDPGRGYLYEAEKDISQTVGNANPRMLGGTVRESNLKRVNNGKIVKKQAGK